MKPWQPLPGMLESTSILLALLLLGDAFFVLLHLVNSLTPLTDNPLLHIAADWGYSEVFQYLKFVWIIALLGALCVRTGRVQYLPWLVTFVYLLLDDSLSIHESLGRVFVARLEFVPMLGLRAQEFGELMATAMAVLLLIPALAFAYLKGTRSFRQLSHDLGLLLVLLVFFGIGFDMLQVLGSQLGRSVGFVLVTIEDGGEMLAVSLIVWYACKAVIEGGTPRVQALAVARNAVTGGWRAITRQDPRTLAESAQRESARRESARQQTARDTRTSDAPI